MKNHTSQHQHTTNQINQNDKTVHCGRFQKPSKKDVVTIQFNECMTELFK